MAIKQKTTSNLQPINQCVQVKFKYDVHFTRGLFDLDNPILAQVIAANGETTPKRVLAVVDGGVLNYQNGLLKKLALYAEFYADVFTLSSEPTIVPGGEVVKNDSRFIEQIHQVIDAVGLCRHSYVLAIGGGAVLDMAGYAAATAHRGIRLLRVPTTVLGQNDSGVGVKNGINAFGKKNFLGTFMPPYAVLNDFDFITSLDDRDWRSGIAEAVKVALIKDADFFNFIMTYADRLANRDMEIMEKLIYRCSQLHLEHIAGGGDPFEMGSSRPLDFGHWAAHKLEHLTNYSLRHGEAVAIGIALDTTYSYLTGKLLQSEWQRILVTLKKLGFTLYVPALAEQLDRPDHPHCIFRGLTEFREHLGGKLTITLLEGIGQGIEVNQVDLSFYKDAISLLQDWELLH
ncbi:3-dehydroquinate synthase [Desmonostoc muscorum LEGE 12446]|uniref:3-dehydroquinate synthase n=1 Tax=Desmonostoc muscorum LEGE 12446 TaxID=1828758 RepID=A0A8J7D457_DESMC|nr:3-dehydroquinate synthase [Desmonostoc muscorum]MCF2151266.1 3-dehydroquinate synthase [Desmonostoc muscorum LEGE 12446]